LARTSRRSLGSKLMLARLTRRPRGKTPPPLAAGAAIAAGRPACTCGLGSVSVRGRATCTGVAAAGVLWAGSRGRRALVWAIADTAAAIDDDDSEDEDEDEDAAGKLDCTLACTGWAAGLSLRSILRRARSKIEVAREERQGQQIMSQCAAAGHWLSAHGQESSHSAAPSNMYDVPTGGDRQRRTTRISKILPRGTRRPDSYNFTQYLSGLLDLNTPRDPSLLCGFEAFCLPASWSHRHAGAAG